jgi:predicted DNA-binding transcriptional regulator AlpA
MNEVVETADQELWSTAEVCRQLGGAGQRSVWRWSHTGIMPPPLKIGAAVRYRRREILDWIASGCQRCD